MIVKLTNAAYSKLRLSDVGEVRTPKLTRAGVDLPYDTNVTLADDAATAASLASGELASAIAAGDVEIVDASGAYAARQLHHAVEPIADQAVYTLPESYVVGNDSLHVYIDGVLQPKPSYGTPTYTETNETTVTLEASVADALLGGEDIQFIWSK